MRKKILIFGGLFAFLGAFLWATDPSYPSWWGTYGIAPTPPLSSDTGNYNAWRQANLAPATAGQLKYVATQAQAYLDDQLASVGGSGPAIGNLVSNFTLTSPYNLSPIDLAQLKNVAQPFYDRLAQVGFNTTFDLNFRLTGNGNATTWAYSYPWNPSTSNTTNKEAAILGQLKFVFTFDLNSGNYTSGNSTAGNFTLSPTLTNNPSGIPDWWLVANGLSPFDGNIGNETSFGDGLTNAQEFQQSLNVFNGTLASGYSGNTAARYTLFLGNITLSSGGNISVPGNFTTGNLTFPAQPVPQYAVIDLGPGGVQDMNDNGDVLIDDGDTYSLWAGGNLASFSNWDDEGNCYGWARVANDDSVEGAFTSSGSSYYDGLARRAPDGNVTTLTDFSSFMPGDATGAIQALEFAIVFFTRNGDIYFTFDYQEDVTVATDADGNWVGYTNSYQEELCWAHDGTLSRIGPVIPSGGDSEDPSAEISFNITTDSANDTLSAHFGNLSYSATEETITYVSSYTYDEYGDATPCYTDYTFTYYDIASSDSTYGYPDGSAVGWPQLRLNGTPVPDSYDIEAWDPGSGRSLATLNYPLVIHTEDVEGYDATLYYLSSGNLTPANLTANATSSTLLNMYAINSLGLATDGEQLWLNDALLSPADYLPARDLNTDLSFNLTAMGISTTITNPYIWFRNFSGNSMTAAATIYGDTSSEAVLLVPASLAVDNNRDGVISFNKDDQTSFENPFRFWLNNNVDRYHTVDKVLIINPDGYWIEDSLNPTLDSGNIDADDPDTNLRGKLDYQLNFVPCQRDLEDFARLWIKINGLQSAIANGNIFVGLKWLPIGNATFNGTNNPAIKLYDTAESNGGTLYLTDNTTAYNQQGYSRFALNDVATYPDSLDYLVQPTSNDWDFILPMAYLLGESSDNSTAHLLFEGCSRGKGELTVVFLKKSGSTYTKIGSSSGSLILDLEDIKDMYERWTVGAGGVVFESAGNMTLPSYSAHRSSEQLPSGSSPFKYSPETPGLSVANDATGNKYILYVHGWNVAPWQRDSDAETMFKRLYWQGYKGKFGAFQWPTTYGYPTLQSPSSFDNGEYTALLSAKPLLELWTNKAELGNYTSSGNLYVMAHSHGNLVVGEALRQAAQQGSTQYVNTYVASQAAIAAQYYDSSITTNVTANATLPFTVANITVEGVTAQISGTFGPDTANILDGWVTTNGTTTAAGTKVNFYNTADFAINLWNMNQIIKPAQTQLNFTYVDVYGLTVSGNFTPTIPGFNHSFSGNLFYAESPYGYSGNVSANISSANLFYKSEYWADNSTLITGPGSTYHLDLGNITQRYEIMAYDAEPRTLAMGEMSGNVGNFTFQSLQALWGGTDPLYPYDFSAHPYHSAQFRFDTPSQDKYWNTLMHSFEITPNH